MKEFIYDAVADIREAGDLKIRAPYGPRAPVWPLSTAALGRAAKREPHRQRRKAKRKRKPG